MGISEEDNIQLTNKLTNSYNIASPLDVVPLLPFWRFFDLYIPL